MRLAWPLIQLCTHYAQPDSRAKEWKEQNSLQLRNAGEPWGLSPDEFLGLIIAAHRDGGFGAVRLLLRTNMGYRHGASSALFLGVMLPPTCG